MQKAAQWFIQLIFSALRLPSPLGFSLTESYLNFSKVSKRGKYLPILKYFQNILKSKQLKLNLCKSDSPISMSLLGEKALIFIRELDIGMDSGISFHFFLKKIYSFIYSFVYLHVYSIEFTIVKRCTRNTNCKTIQLLPTALQGR